MRHLYYLTPDERVLAGKWSWISQPFVIMGFATGKISVGLMLLRIMGPNTVWRRYLVLFAISTAFVISCINVVLTYAQCSPVDALWNPSLIAEGKATCLKPSIQTDFAIFLSSKYPASCLPTRPCADDYHQAGTSSPIPSWPFSPSLSCTSSIYPSRKRSASAFC